MPLTDATRKAIHDYLVGELTRYVREAKNAGDNLDTKPFHARLLPSLFSAALSERSFSTRSGSWWQVIARLIGIQYHADARNSYRVTGHIKPAAAQHIAEIISQLNNPATRRAPNRVLDINEVLTVQSQGGDSTTALADLYIKRHDGTELFFEIKTPMPNKDTSMAMKRRILTIAAMKKGSPAEAYGATAYNPFGQDEPYTWNYARQFLEIDQDMLIGKYFWTKIGDGSTYDELLQVSEEVGKDIAKLLVEE